MSSYHGRHAELYDVFYADKPYAQEAAFVHQLLQELSLGATRRILELACGTGSHGLAYERLGYQVTATDDSEDMLAVASAKASAAGSRVMFSRQDMCALQGDGRPFDAVVCLFDSIGYVQTNEAMVQVFRGVHSCLRDDGLFVFEFWHAGAMLRSYDPLRVRRWALPDREILRITETKLSCARQLAEVSYCIYEFKPDGTYTTLKEVQVNRFFLVEEMKALLTSGGLLPLKFFAGFSSNATIDENTWHVIAVARKCRGTAQYGQ